MDPPQRRVQSGAFLCVSIRFQRRTTHFEVHIDEKPYFGVDFSKSVSTVMTSPFNIYVPNPVYSTLLS